MKTISKDFQFRTKCVNFYVALSIMLLAAVYFISGCTNKKYVAPADALFTKLSPSACGIDFRNDVTDDSVFNEINYRNFYNGGGVAIGDINNDGLADVFMTANQGLNKLYLNKGKMQFEDITQKAGITKLHKWSTGVTMADVNGDGLLDIYVCNAGITDGDNRANELFINNGNLQFTESAALFNLQDTGAFHTQASFFDYDLDGDLDAFLLNNNCMVPVGNYTNGRVRTFSDKIHGDKLLRNDNGVFKNVSDSSGIYGSNIGFGLGVAVSDINNDGWPDMYISNDFFEKDYLYINQKNGSFKEVSDSYISHMSQSSMGADMADINNDGLIDIFSTDMLPEDDYRLKKNTLFEDYDTYIAKAKAGLHYQLLGNMLHLNNGNNTFSEIAQFAGVDATEWSWGALIFDLDNNGWKDIVVCNGMFLDVTDQDYINYVADENKRKLFQKSRAVSNYEQLKEMLVSKPLPNYAFINQKNLQFINKSPQLGLGEPGYSNGAAYGDLDNDGDLDLIVNNLNSESFVYQNNTSVNKKKHYVGIQLSGSGMNKFGVGATVSLYSGGMQQVQQLYPARGFQSCVDTKLIFGLDETTVIDSIVVQWPYNLIQVLHNPSIDTLLVVKQADAIITSPPAFKKMQTFFTDVTAAIITGNITHHENEYVDFNVERLMPHTLSAEGPCIAVADVNGDGREDFIMGAARRDTMKVFVQTKQGTFTPLLPQAAFESDAEFEDTGLELFDVDGDGDHDLVAVSGGNIDKEGSPLLRPRLYLNNGKGVFTKSESSLPNISLDASCVKAFDFDSDGDKDLFVGGRCIPGQYGAKASSYLLRNDKGIFIDVTLSVSPLLKQIGMVTDAVWADTDNDNRIDLVLVGEWMPVTILKNNGNQFVSSPLNEQFKKSAGWWNSLQAADLDNDGDVDFVLGNLGLNSKLKADSLHPAKLYLNDFDKNGRKECVMAYYKSDGKLYPYYLRGDIVTQMPSLRKKFFNYVDYAGKTMNEVFSVEQLKDAAVSEAYCFQSSVIYNLGKGKFILKPLPLQAQFSYIYNIVVNDVNNDGLKDIYLSGNTSGLKPELGKYDANFGLLLLGNKTNGFITTNNSGLFYNGEARDARIIKLNGNNEAILLALNNQPLRIFKKNN